MYKKIKSISIYFLLLMIFFNCVFVNIVLGMSMLMQSESGPADRVRQYEDQIFTYSKYEGFSCKVEGIIKMGDKTPSYLNNNAFCSGEMNTDGSCSGNVASIGEVAYKDPWETLLNKGESLLATFGIIAWKGLIRTFQCSAVGWTLTHSLSSAFLSVANSGVVSFFREEESVKATQETEAKEQTKTNTGTAVIIITNILDGMIDEFIRDYLGDNDYMVDTSNGDCDWIKWTQFAFCAGIAGTSAVLSLINFKENNNIKKLIAFAVLTTISSIVDGILLAVSVNEYKQAAINFDTFSMCGSEWLVIGSDEIEEELKKESNIETNKFVLNKTEIPNNTSVVELFDDSHIGKVGEKIVDINDKILSFISDKILSLGVISTADIVDGAISKLMGTGIFLPSYEHQLLNSRMNNYGIDKDAKKPTSVSTYNGSNKLPIEFYPSYGEFNGSYKRLLNECFSNRRQSACEKLFPNFTQTDTTIDDLADYKNKAYREYIYGGMEYEHIGCIDPRPERASYGAGKGQQYYFRGPQKANFACERFNTSIEYRDAYRCCLNASQSLICIKGKYTTIFNRNNIPRIDTEKYVMCNIDNLDSCELPSANQKVEPSQVNCQTIKESLNELEKNINDNKGQIEAKEIQQMENSKESYKNMYDTYCDSNGNPKQEQKKDEKKKIKFNIKQSIFADNKYCVETKNLCPYNFKIGGGTEILGSGFNDYTKEDVEILIDSNGNAEEKTNSSTTQEKNKMDHCEFIYDKEASKNCKGKDNKKCKKGSKYCRGLAYDDINKTFYSAYKRPSNFCQLDRHCTRVNKVVEDEVVQYSPFVAKACFNMIGSSHNFENYKNVGQSYQMNKNSNLRLLIAPLVECTVETFRNFLLNTAGHTRCTNNNEISFDDISCESGTDYVKGDRLDEINDVKFPNYFIKLKTMLVNLTKVFMVLMVVLFGFNLANGKESLAPSNITKKILLLVLVSYFSISNNWVRPIFKASFDLINYAASKSMELSQKTGNISKDYDYPGCYFFKNKYISNNYDSYGDKNYLAVFDTLDCKIAMYLGYLSDITEDPPILGLFMASLFTFGLVITLIYPIIALFITIISLSLQVALLFIEANLKCCLLLFFAPIIIPTVLFEYSRGFFTKWLDEIRKTFYSSIFLVVGLNAFMYVFDSVYIGDAKFIGTRTPLRNVYCGKICKISNDNFYFIDEDRDDLKNDCDKVYNGEVINLKEEAPICFFTAKHKTTTSSSSIFKFIANNFIFMANIIVSVGIMFKIFLKVVFMCVIAYVFRMSIEYLSEANSQIFGTGFSDSLSKDITETMTELMSKLANFGTKANPLRYMSFGDFWNKKVGGVENGGGGNDGENGGIIKRHDGGDEEDRFDINTTNQNDDVNNMNNNNDVNNMNNNNDVNNINNDSDITGPKITGKNDE